MVHLKVGPCLKIQMWYNRKTCRLEAGRQQRLAGWLERDGHSVQTVPSGEDALERLKEAKFDILLVRCREGILFTSNTEPIHACFVLAGTHDERNLHLRMLMSIAGVVQQPDFMNTWLKAKRPKELRKIILNI